MRPLLIGSLLASVVFVLVALALSRPEGWFAPFLAFSIVGAGLASMLHWAIQHRHDR